MKIISVVGTRPNFMKIAPIANEIKNHPEIKHFLVHTGQHYDEKMSDNFFKELGIPQPDYNLQIGSDTQSKQVANIMIAFEEVCDQVQPDALIIVGDVNSTMAAALVAAKKGIKTFHVEAGIRSNDRSMPEEINRLVTDAISDFLLPPSKDAYQNLLNEGHSPNQIEIVGNIMIDTLMKNQQNIKASNILKNLDLENIEYAVLTLHRPSNVDNESILKDIFKAIDYTQNILPIIYPIHPRSKKMLQQFGLLEYVKSLPNLKLVESLGYIDFGRLVSSAKFVLTDSGGIQEETTVYGIPCITIRENTERPITIDEGSNELAGVTSGKIIELVDKVINNNWKESKTPYLWDGKTAGRIIQYIKSKLD